MKIKGYRVTFTGKLIIIEFLLSLIGVLCGFTWKIHNVDKKWENLIYPGINVASLDVGGKTIDEAKRIINSSYIEPLLNNKITVFANGRFYTIDNSKLNIRYDVDSAVSQALNLGKNFTPYERSRLIKEGVYENYEITPTFDEEYLKEFVEAVERDINKEPVNAHVQRVSSGQISISPEEKGFRLQKDKLEEELKKKISENYNKNIEIEAPTVKIDAAVTADKLSTINTKIAGFITDFSSSSAARAQNVNLAANFINGKLLMPGDTFSFNDSVGERTKERGFAEAPVIIGNKIESGLGGGICQVSSTLYNAILRAGIKPLERTHHTLPSSYVGLGLDATVDWDGIDFKFKNTFAYPIYIEAYSENRKLNINIYSNSSLADKKYNILNNIYETVPSSVKIIDDPNIPVGQVLVEQKGYDGHKVRTVRNIYENGIVVGTETISDDFYIPVASIIRKGVKLNK